MSRLFVLAAPEDQSAGAVAAAAADCLGPGRVISVPASDLWLGRLSWEMSPEGEVASTLRLPGGGAVEPGPDDVVFNRCPPPNPPAFAGAAAADRDYACAEAAAVLTALFDGWPARALNPPGPFGVAGPDLGPLRWLDLARRAGLPVPAAAAACPGRAAGPLPAGWEARPTAPTGWITTRPGADEAALLPGSVPQIRAERLGEPSCRVLLCAGAVFGAALSEPLLRGVRRLAELAGAPVLEVRFATAAAGGLRFCEASPVPCFSPAEIDFVAARLAALVLEGS